MPRRPVKSSLVRMTAASRPTATTPTPTPTSTSTPTPLSSAGPSACTSEVSIASLTLNTPLTPLTTPKRRAPMRPFPFLSLPSELRVKVYEQFFDDTDRLLDLGPDNYKRIHKLLGLMRVCRQIHAEATHFFYSTRTIRIFPTYPGRFFKTKKPLLARLKACQRECITSLELRLGPGWNAPPRGWVVNDALGLADCVRVRKLRVFVECDPSDGVFNGFRRSDGFYEGFSRLLLASVMDGLPALHAVEFDAWSSVNKSGAMMRGLVGVATQARRLIRWGPERGWSDAEQQETADAANRLVEGIPMQGYAHDVVAVA